jgi:hypothetical protein
VDRKTDEGPVKVVGYRYTATRYVRMRPDAQRRYLLPGLGLRIGAKGDRVALYDADSGEEVGDYTAVTRALEAAVAAHQAEAVARQAEAAARQAEAAARQAAESEVTRLQARMRELEERMRRRNGRPSAQD